MTPLQIEMLLTKSTKGTHVYGNKSADVTTIYIKKNALPDTPPKTIVLTIETV